MDHAAAAQSEAQVTRIDELDRAFAALADPTRREVIRCLLEKPRRAGELAHALDLTAPAMSKHLRVLRHARLVSESGIADDARVRVYRVDAEAFRPLGDWIEAVAHWRGQLRPFKAHAERRRKR